MTLSIKLGGMTAKQGEKFSKAEAQLPPGYDYRLHREKDDGTKGDIWGLTVYKNEKNVGRAQKPKKGFLTAHTTCAPEMAETVRLLLNRGCAALWGKQPQWQF